VAASGGWLLYGGQHDVRVGVLAGALSLGFWSLVTVYQPVFKTRSRFGWVAIADVGGRIAFSIAIVVAALADVSLVWLCALLAIPPAFALGLLALRAHGEIRLRPRFSPRIWLPLLKEALPIGASLLIFALYFRIDLLMVGFFRSPHEVGEYALDLRIVEAVLAVPAVFTGALFPVLSSMAGSRRFAVIGSNAASLMLFAGVFVAVAGSVLAPAFISVLVGADYKGASPALAVLLVACGLSYVTSVWGSVLITGGDQGFLLRFSAVNLSVNIVLNLVLIPFAGLIGAAVATVVTEALATLVAYQRCRHKLDIRLEWGPWSRALLAGAVTALVMLVVPSSLWSVRAAAGTATYAIAMVALGVVSRESLQTWRGWSVPHV
jgi:O-antigen/teichoic acid export membrane protein